MHPTNPHYFTDRTANADGSPKVIYLGGHQIFVDLQDNAFNKAEDLAAQAHPPRLSFGGHASELCCS